MPKYRVTKSAAGQRIDVFAVQKLEKYSRSSLKMLFANAKVKINGRAAKGGDKLAAGDVVEVDTKDLRRRVKSVSLPVLYEDKDVLVIDKPAGILTHSKGALNNEPTVASFILPKITDKRLAGNRAGIVHRLDRLTSGVIITAKNYQSLKYLQRQFATHAVTKKYVAIVEGALRPPAAIIDAPIKRNPVKPQTFKVQQAGKPAVTKFRLVKNLEAEGKLFSLVEFEPQTGRTHQLRVHSAYIGHPIAGDKVYGGGDGELMLHALSLKIRLPNGEVKEFKAPLPTRFNDYDAK